jgi:acetate kinase
LCGATEGRSTRTTALLPWAGSSAWEATTTDLAFDAAGSATMTVLVVNSGSSSIKFQLLRMEDRSRLCVGLLDRIGFDDGMFSYTPEGREALRRTLCIKDHSEGIRLILQAICDPSFGVLASLDQVTAVGHRVVHGGEAISKAELITVDIENVIQECGTLAPLHNAANLMGIRAVKALLPMVPHVAVFDTAFHATMPKESFLFGLPYGYYETYGIRRFGFHGTSHRFVSRRAAEILGRDPRTFRGVTCHMGNGVSMAAIRDGLSVDTSLGFGTMCGVPMGTRAGDVDPAAILYLADSLGMSLKEIRRVLYFESGLKGLSGLSSDMRDIEGAVDTGNARAQLALQVFAHACRRHIAALATSLGGKLDAIVFTGGIGEHSCRSRSMICAGLEVLGVEINEVANEARGIEAVISKPSSRVAVLVIPTNEELMIALETEQVVKESRPLSSPAPTVPSAPSASQ